MNTAAQSSKSAAQTLAAYATSLKYEDIPAEVLTRAKACILDTIAVASLVHRCRGAVSSMNIHCRTAVRARRRCWAPR